MWGEIVVWTYCEAKWPSMAICNINLTDLYFKKEWLSACLFEYIMLSCRSDNYVFLQKIQYNINCLFVKLQVLAPCGYVNTDKLISFRWLISLFSRTSSAVYSEHSTARAFSMKLTLHMPKKRTLVRIACNTFTIWTSKGFVSLQWPSSMRRE